MTSEHNAKLLEKRKQLQLRNRFNEFVKTDIMPFTEVLNELNNSGVKYRFVSLRYGSPEFMPLFGALFQTERFSLYGFPSQELVVDNTVMTKLLETYPSTHSSRFFPDLPVIDVQVQSPKNVLQAVIKKHQLPNSFVYICWIRYAFLIEVSLEDLSNKITRELLNNYDEDVVLFPKDYSWVLVYHAFENEWLFGT